MQFSTIPIKDLFTRLNVNDMRILNSNYYIRLLEHSKRVQFEKSAFRQRQTLDILIVCEIACPNTKKGPQLTKNIVLRRISVYLINEIRQWMLSTGGVARV